MSRSYYDADSGKMSRPLGCYQIEILRRFRSGENDRWTGYIPTRANEPWPVLKSLMRRGLMASKKQRACYWQTNKKWSEETRYDYYACLTVDGDNAILDIDYQEAMEESQ